ncbi:hypothetical protein HZS_2219, partial [Henneguya salminicola]
RDKILFSENECCDPKTCKYRQIHYNCWYGKCCKKCKIARAIFVFLLKPSALRIVIKRILNFARINKSDSKISIFRGFVI